jgi:hypothetical protein
MAMNSRHPLDREPNAELLLNFPEGALDRAFVSFTTAAGEVPSARPWDACLVVPQVDEHGVRAQDGDLRAVEG